MEEKVSDSHMGVARGEALTAPERNTVLEERILPHGGRQLASGAVPDANSKSSRTNNRSEQNPPRRTRRGRPRRARSVGGRNPFNPCANAFLEAVRPYYAASTHRTITRGLKVIGDAFKALRKKGKVSTINPRKMTQADIEAFLQWMKDRKTKTGIGLRPATQANYLAFLAEMLLICENPVMNRMRALHYVRFPQKVSPEIRTLEQTTVEELRAKLANMPGWDGEVARFAVAMYAYTGLRRSELRKARLQDIDISKWRVLVSHPKGETRYASAGTAPILQPARQTVLDFLKARTKYLTENGVGECEPLVPRIYRDGRVDYWTDGMWGSMKDDAQKHAGIPFRVQYLRATFGQMCKDRGASIESVSKALRHRTTRTTELYYARIRSEDAFRELEEAFAEKP
ncbi:MAG: site-specific integrase [Candidatus Thermoplasmatota archaeon]